MWKWRLLLLPAALMLTVAAELTYTLLWGAPWPPSDPSMDLRAWLLVAVLATGGGFFAWAALRPQPRRLSDSRRPWAKVVELLPYPMNNDG